VSRLYETAMVCIGLDVTYLFDMMFCWLWYEFGSAMMGSLEGYNVTSSVTICRSVQQHMTTFANGLGLGKASLKAQLFKNRTDMRLENDKSHDYVIMPKLSPETSPMSKSFVS